MNNLNYLFTGENVTIVIDGQTYVVSSKHGNFSPLVKALRAKDVDSVKDLVTPKRAVKKYTLGKVEVNGDKLFCGGLEVKGAIAQRVLSFMEAGKPFDNLLRFIERIDANPSYNSKEQLYKFLEHRGLPITERGTFFGYKGIQLNMYSVRSNTSCVVTNDNPAITLPGVKDGYVYNGLGSKPRMTRNQVDDDPNSTCSVGLHVGSREYAVGWGAKTIVVEVDPVDVVSVPNDCNCQKMRTCGYTVVGVDKGYLNELEVNSSNPYGNAKQETNEFDDWINS